MIDRSTWRFDENASYVVAGGLGGLGRPMIRWMADRGAKYLILLSRSGGAQSQAATELVSELLEKGIHVSIPRCDVSSAPALSAALGSVLNSTESLPFPPVKGCINATMVLQVCLACFFF
jgi:NAD(P)-dependent dehydrogenase (short-subunit alcohol dehydrogenase family)